MSDAGAAPTPEAEAPEIVYVVVYRDQEGVFQRVPIGERPLLVGGAADRKPDILLGGLARSQATIARDAAGVTVTNRAGPGEAWIENVELLPNEPMRWERGSLLRLGADGHTLRLDVADRPQELAPSLVPPLSAPAATPILRLSEPELRIVPNPEPLQIELTLFNPFHRPLSYQITFSSEGAMERALRPIKRYASEELQPNQRMVLQLALTVPRSPEVRPGRYPVRVTAAIGGVAETVFEKDYTWSIAAYPPRGNKEQALRSGQGELSAQYEPILHNDSNAPLFYRLRAKLKEAVIEEPDGQGVSQQLELTGDELAFEFDPDSRLVQVDRGGAAKVGLIVQAQRPVAERTRFAFELVAQPTGLPESAASTWSGEFIQTPPPPEQRGALLAGVAAATAVGLLLALSVWYWSASIEQAAIRDAAETATAQAISTQLTFVETQSAHARGTSQALLDAQYATLVASAVISQSQQFATQTAAVVAIKETTQAVTLAELAPVLENATALANQQTSLAVAGAIATEAAQQAQALGQTGEALRNTEVGAIAEAATGAAGQTTTAVAAQTIVAQAQQQATSFAEARTQVARDLTRQTELAEPGSVSIAGVAPCVATGQSIDTVYVTVNDRTGQPATSVVVTATLELQPVSGTDRPRLEGESQKQTDNGIARFFGLKIDRVGKYRFLGRVGRFNPAPSEVFEVVEPGGSCGTTSAAATLGPGSQTTGGDEADSGPPPLLPPAELVTPEGSPDGSVPGEGAAGGSPSTPTSTVPAP
jgi:hypothetical protein